jgi:imidazolonepropionase-like amidohydrolase
VEDDRFAELPGTGAVTVDGRELWVIPGIRDVHVHIAWSDFHAEDRSRRTASEQQGLTHTALAATLRAGVTSIRDGGGAPAALRDALASGQVSGPRLQVSVDMIGRTDGGPDAVRARVSAAIERGAQWIKLVATAGVAAAAEAALESHFTAAEFAAAADEAERGGARLMVHTWGGASIDHAIEVGAASIEHGIFLTEAQAARAASAGVTYVPTLTVYRHVREGVARGEIDGVPLSRLDAAIAQHETAVLRARDAGLAVALGSDFGTAEQHGTNRAEIASLLRAGLSPSEALIAATAAGARLLGDGTIEPGAPADAVVFRSDPALPTTHEDRDAVALVIEDGRIVHGADPSIPNP